MSLNVYRHSSLHQYVGIFVIVIKLQRDTRLRVLTKSPKPLFSVTNGEKPLSS